MTLIIIVENVELLVISKHLLRNVLSHSAKFNRVNKQLARIRLSALHLHASYLIGQCVYEKLRH